MHETKNIKAMLIMITGVGATFAADGAPEVLLVGTGVVVQNWSKLHLSS